MTANIKKAKKKSTASNSKNKTSIAVFKPRPVNYNNRQIICSHSYKSKEATLKRLNIRDPYYYKN